MKYKTSKGFVLHTWSNGRNIQITTYLTHFTPYALQNILTYRKSFGIIMVDRRNLKRNKSYDHTAQNEGNVTNFVLQCARIEKYRSI